MAAKKAVKKKSDVSFEQSLDKLEQIVHQLEDGDLPLAESLDRYEKGVSYLKSCYELLERAERRIELLKGVDAESKPITEPFDEEDESVDGDSPAAARPRKRSRRAATQRAAPQRGGDGTAGGDVDEHGLLF